MQIKFPTSQYTYPEIPHWIGPTLNCMCPALASSHGERTVETMRLRRWSEVTCSKDCQG